ncbi:hypothetical protein EV421DRAFT_1738608 [Armillaria borealis]|uniref:Uncharacterized protein n=1 Tax=Armillaria borealis TaxID=47425 RepID=A0AA39JCT9_9AGAR|nr:hypothetical protein EV421DRAFT_1738608 [Armillaria borealis]
MPTTQPTVTASSTAPAQFGQSTQSKSNIRYTIADEIIAQNRCRLTVGLRIIREREGPTLLETDTSPQLYHACETVEGRETGDTTGQYIAGGPDTRDTSGQAAYPRHLDGSWDTQRIRMKSIQSQGTQTRKKVSWQSGTQGHLISKISEQRHCTRITHHLAYTITGSIYMTIHKEEDGNSPMTWTASWAVDGLVSHIERRGHLNNWLRVSSKTPGMVIRIEDTIHVDGTYHRAITTANSNRSGLQLGMRGYHIASWDAILIDPEERQIIRSQEDLTSRGGGNVEGGKDVDDCVATRR